MIHYLRKKSITNILYKLPISKHFYRIQFINKYRMNQLNSHLLLAIRKCFVFNVSFIYIKNGQLSHYYQKKGGRYNSLTFH